MNLIFIPNIINIFKLNSIILFVAQFFMTISCFMTDHLFIFAAL